MVAKSQRFMFVRDDQDNIVDAFKMESYHDDDYIPRSLYVLNDKKQRQYEDETTGRRKPILKDGYTTYISDRDEFDAWVQTRVPEYEDIVGRPVFRGSRVAVAFALGRGAEIRVGTVIGFDLTLAEDGGYNTYASTEDIGSREQIVIEWEADNRRWGSKEGKTSKIFAGLRRYVVID